MHFSMLCAGGYVKQECLGRVVGASCSGELSKGTPLLEQPAASELFRFVEHQRDMFARAHGEGFVILDIDQEVGATLRVHAICKAPQPAEGVTAVRSARMPIRH